MEPYRRFDTDSLDEASKKLGVAHYLDGASYLSFRPDCKRHGSTELYETIQKGDVVLALLYIAETSKVSVARFLQCLRGPALKVCEKPVPLDGFQCQLIANPGHDPPEFNFATM